MMMRVLRILALLGIAIALASCATTKSTYPLDWNALEQQQVNSVAMTLSPEVELFNLRVSLLQKVIMTSTTTQNGYGGTTTTTQTEYPEAVYGANLGNGLSIDTENNIFLDVFSLVKADMNGTFDMKVGTDRIQKTAGSFKVLNFAGIATDVTASPTGVMLKSPITQWGYRIEGATYKYKAPIPLLANYDMDVSPTKLKIRVYKLLTINQDATLDGARANLWGAYTVTKQGDTYTIQEQRIFGKTYKVYYAGSHILFCEGDTVLRDIVVLPDQITANGQKVIEYHLGG